MVINDNGIYPLVICYSLILNIIHLVQLSSLNYLLLHGDFPVRYVSLPEDNHGENDGKRLWEIDLNYWQIMETSSKTCIFVYPKFFAKVYKVIWLYNIYVYIYRGCNMDTKWDMYNQLDMIWPCPSIVRHLWENHIKFVGYLRHMLGCISLFLNIIWIFHGVLWDIFHQYHDWLVVYLPLWKIMEWKSVGMMKFPIYGKS